MKNYIKQIISVISLSILFMIPMQPTMASTNGNKHIENGSKVLKRHSDNIIHIKFAETDEVQLQGSEFVSKKGNKLDAVNSSLSSAKIAKKSPLFTTSPDTITEERTKIKKQSSAEVPNLNNYFRIELKEGADLDSTIKELKLLPNLADVYAEPLAAPSPVSPSYVSLQSYFTPSPQGMGITASANYPGAKGDMIKIADLEYSWNRYHEDIVDARQSDTVIPNGTYADPFNDNNHGTAVTGILNGSANSYGINGIVPNAKLHLVGTNNIERGWDMANAIYQAQTKLSTGDVMLIEQQTWGPSGRGYVPVEWVGAVYDAIKLSTTKGIIVIEAAANGGENLDDPVFGSTFPQGKPDSGAIMVGAGSACYGVTKHSRLWFSNYGNRVNVQGYGECVATTGYGYLNGTAGVNAWYMDSFSGTSSASALIAGVAGSVSSSYEKQKGTSMTPAQIRSLLISTGSPQDKTYDTGNIGPLANLNAALKTFTDTTPPSSPTGLTASVTSLNKVSMSWKASTDNSGKVSYRVYRNNIKIATTTSPSYLDNNVVANTTYSYKIRAVDPTGNVSSAYSNTVTVITRP